MVTTADGLEEIAGLAGADLGVSSWLTVTQERIDTFAEATGDDQWIHVDPHRAKDGPFGTTIAHGYLTLALVVPLFSELLVIQGVAMTVNYGLGKVRFPSPVPVDSRIQLHALVESTESLSQDSVQTCFTFEVRVEGATKPACVAQVVYRHFA